VFDQDEDDGVVILLDDEPGPAQHQAVREAANLCPAAIIHFTESEKASATSR
jgi:ferredoxin